MRLSTRRFLPLILLGSVFCAAQENRTDAPRLFEKGLNALTGMGESHNDVAAVEYIRRASDLGYAPAQVALGSIYETGAANVSPQASVAMDYYKKASKQDDKVGDWLLGRSFLTGVAVPRDLNQALVPLRQAAKQNDPFGEHLLGVVLLEKNQYAEAVDWFRKASMQGLPQAQLQLGLLLKDAPGGIHPDKFEAYIWLLMSSRAGNAAAGAHLGLLESELTSAQVERAKSQVRELEATSSRAVVARGCTGWPGEFETIPAAPPVDIQGFCR